MNGSGINSLEYRLEEFLGEFRRQHGRNDELLSRLLIREFLDAATASAENRNAVLSVLRPVESVR